MESVSTTLEIKSAGVTETGSDVARLTQKFDELLNSAKAARTATESAGTHGANAMVSFRTQMRTESAALSALGIDNPLEKYAHTFEYLNYQAERSGKTVAGMLPSLLPGIGAAAAIGLIAMKFKEIADVGQEAFTEAGMGAHGFFDNFAVGAGLIDITIHKIEKTAEVMKELGEYGKKQDAEFAKASRQAEAPTEANMRKWDKADIEEHYKAQTEGAKALAEQAEKTKAGLTKLSEGELEDLYRATTGKERIAPSQRWGATGTEATGTTVGMMREAVTTALDKDIQNYQQKARDAAATRAQGLEKLSSSEPTWWDTTLKTLKQKADEAGDKWSMEGRLLTNPLMQRGAIAPDELEQLKAKATQDIEQSRAAWKEDIKQMREESPEEKASEKIRLGQLSGKRDLVGEIAAQTGKMNDWASPDNMARAEKRLTAAQEKAQWQMTLISRADSEWGSLIGAAPRHAGAFQSGTVAAYSERLKSERQPEVEKLAQEHLKEAQHHSKLLEQLTAKAAGVQVISFSGGAN